MGLGSTQLGRLFRFQHWGLQPVLCSWQETSRSILYHKFLGRFFACKLNFCGFVTFFGSLWADSFTQWYFSLWFSGYYSTTQITIIGPWSAAGKSRGIKPSEYVRFFKISVLWLQIFQEFADLERSKTSAGSPLSSLLCVRLLAKLWPSSALLC